MKESFGKKEVEIQRLLGLLAEKENELKELIELHQSIGNVSNGEVPGGGGERRKGRGDGGGSGGGGNGLVEKDSREVAHELDSEKIKTEKLSKALADAEVTSDF